MCTFPEVSDVVRATNSTRDMVEKSEDIDNEGYARGICDLQVCESPELGPLGIDAAPGRLPLPSMPASSGVFAWVCSLSGISSSIFRGIASRW